MTSTDSPRRCRVHLLSRLLHWAMAVMVIGQFFLGGVTMVRAHVLPTLRPSTGTGNPHPGVRRRHLINRLHAPAAAVRSDHG